MLPSSSQVLTAVTLHSRSACQLSNILRQSLSERKHELSSSDQVLLFALAPPSTTPPEILSDITSTLTQFYPVHVGCISAPLSYQHFGSRVRSEPNSCSLAYAFVNAVPFRSTISGRAEVQVGRWHSARQRMQEADEAIRFRSEASQMRIFSNFSDSDGKINWEDVWKLTGDSVSRQADGKDSEMLPDALRNLDPSAVDSIFYFSDKQPDGLATMLEGAFPQAIKLSLVASSTPFITGRPFTLFHNGSILSDGAVGIAFSSSSSSSPPVVELSFPPLVALSTNLTVTSSEGNLILSLDCQNPTKLLLNAIRDHDLPSHMTCVAKEDEFYVGVIDSSTEQISQLHRINAGDPSRGSIALDVASSLKEGTIVRLYQLRSDAVPDAATRVQGRFPNISLIVAPEMNPSNVRDKNAEGVATDIDCSAVSNAFLVASENGFTLSRGAQGAWNCIVPGARAGLSWD